MRKVEFMRRWMEANSTPNPPDNEVWYYAPAKVSLYSSSGVVSHTFADGRGILTFAGAVTTVKDWLRGRSTITNVEMPSTVTSIVNSAFESCSNLELAILPSGITSIGYRAFFYCKKLALEELPIGLTRIESRVFEGCSNLALESLPDGVTSIGEAAFSQTNVNITELPSGITKIGYASFRDCNKLRSITFNGTPTDIINESAFVNNNNLTDIYVPWSDGEVANAPWGATNATIHYNYTPTNNQ